jgi:hypothetical protein
MTACIVRMAEEHVAGSHAVLDSVAREQRYLAMLEAPPLESVRKFVCESLATERPQFVALAEGGAVGWCDVIEKPRDALRHSGVLGVGVLAGHRGRHRRGASRAWSCSWLMAWLC